MNNHKAFLKQVFDTIPGEERIAFLKEVMQTLSSEERQALLSDLGTSRNDIPSPFQSTSSASTRTSQHQFRKAPKTEPPAKRTPEQLKALAETEFNKMIAAQPRVNRNNMLKQLLTLLAMGFVGIVVIVLLAMGSQHLWEWLLKKI